MGLRQIRLENDPILYKKTREIKNINDRILSLLDDMVETMREHNGIGLAAPQVGILRRCFVAEVNEGEVYKVINPEIIEREGKAVQIEGCLSMPDFRGTVERAEKIKMKYTDENGKEQIIEAEGLLARCFQHESDHLDGVLIRSKYIKEISDEEYQEILDSHKVEEEM